jgi:glycosyltransferase involved in cell wall biosynthesis
MGRRVLYLRPEAEPGNGVRAYSERVLEAFRRYGDGRYQLIDGSYCLHKKGEAPERLALQLGETVAAAVQRESAALVFAEMGVGEFQVFHALRGLKRLSPKIPTLVTVHDPPRTVVNLNPLFHPRQGHTAVRALRWLYNRTLGAGTEREFLAQEHHWLVLSVKGKRLWKERLNAAGASAGALSIVQHLNYYDDGEIPCPMPDRPLRLGLLGSITRSKGIDILVDALALLKAEAELPEQLVVEIAGAALYRQDQRYLEELKRQLARHGIGEEVSFSGYLPDDALPGFFSRIDLLVLPYRETGSGSASGPLMWARSFGIPVVATRTRNLPELVQDKKDGMLCEAGSADSLARCLRAAWQEPQLSVLREGAAQRRDWASWQVCVAGLTDVFDSIISSQGNRKRR